MIPNIMCKHTPKFLILTCLFFCLGLASLQAQEEEKPAAEKTEETKTPPEEQKFQEGYVVTGSRARPRSVTDSMVPIDVISGKDFANQGDTDMSNQLRNLVPSYNVNSQPISDAASIVRPANLRGLAPDHTLVLVNGKRRHRAAVIYWLGNGVADGAQGPDISAIPSIAVRQVEVLRDGASAQYGSDAIAGVMNFMLKDNREGFEIEARSGSYYEGDGNASTISANLGLPLGANGFANISVEFGQTDPTSRSVQRDDAAGLIAAGNTAVGNPAQIWGSPEIEDDLKLWGNFGYNFDNGTEFYGHANMVSKTVTGGFYFRNPNTRSGVFSGDGGETLLVGDLNGSGDCPVVPVIDGVPDADALAEVLARGDCFTFQEIFPGGFTPNFGGELTDQSLVAGLRGFADNGLYWDVSASYGTNEVDFFINNTVNASLGPDSPTSFDPGLYKQEEVNLNVDLSYAVNDLVNVAFGAEYRDETFEIGIGQLESYQIGPLATQGFSAASNGFPGFSDIAAGSWSRANIALYADLELSEEKWTVGIASRYEDYDDFGTTMNAKIAGHYKFQEHFSVRGSLSSGFRAPTPGQSNAFNVSTEFDLALGDLVNNGTIPSSSAVAQLRGGEPLEPEQSINFTLGTIFQVGALSITADYFRIELSDRLGVTQLFSLTDEEVDELIAEGVTSAGNLNNFRFFSNDFETETSGVDVVATYVPEANDGRTVFNLIFNYTKTDVVAFNPDTLDPTRIRELQEALPEMRWNLSGTHEIGDFRFLARLSYYDDWFDSEDVEVYSGEFLTDAEISYSIGDNLGLMIGAQNIFDTTPEENPNAASGVGNRYSQFSPFGFNGGFYYGRFSYKFNR